MISSTARQSSRKPISSTTTASLHASFTALLAILVHILLLQEALAMATTLSPHRVSIVTGANGYLGRTICIELLKRHGGASNEAQQSAVDSDNNNNNNKQTAIDSTKHSIIGLVRSAKVAAEQTYWDQVCQTISNNGHSYDNNKVNVCIKPYDMLDNGESLSACLDSLPNTEPVTVCVYHTASVFGPTEDHKQTALDNVHGTMTLVQILAEYQNGSQQANTVRLVLTSSMAAVRATAQTPQNGQYYTIDDWNTVSVLGENWGSSYQWSKAESERVAKEMCSASAIPLVAHCPSFIIGPVPAIGSSVVATTSSSFSIQLVRDWMLGKSPVQSRLWVDLRDVARAHVVAGQDLEINTPDGPSSSLRYILSTEKRVSSQQLAEWLQEAISDHRKEAGQSTETAVFDPAKIHFDSAFTGGAIPIGQREVDCMERVKTDLGVELRPVKETIMDMARYLMVQETVKECSSTK
jgi:nucleoside-diphosphate-sugar epimerase